MKHPYTKLGLLQGSMRTTSSLSQELCNELRYYGEDYTADLLYAATHMMFGVLEYIKDDNTEAVDATFEELEYVVAEFIKNKEKEKNETSS